MAESPENLPFDGAISDYYHNGAPDEVRQIIEEAEDKEILRPPYPYETRLKKSAYEDELAALQIELVRMQGWARETGQRIVIVFEGRDAAGKGGTIKRLTENLNPRAARTVALSKPSDTEAGQWYFQRYIEQLPTSGEIVIFDRSWYNRGVVEHVFGFCTPEERALWFEQVGPFEKMLVDDGIILRKFWLNIGRATQLKRFLDRERDPLKQWKLSWIDVEGLKKWDAYSAAIQETLERTHSDHAPWTVVKSDDKRRLRLEVIHSVLKPLDYPGKGSAVEAATDASLVGGPELWSAG